MRYRCNKFNHGFVPSFVFRINFNTNILLEVLPFTELNNKISFKIRSSVLAQFTKSTCLKKWKMVVSKKGSFSRYLARFDFKLTF